MSFNYAATAAMATRLLAQFGQTVTLSKVTPGAYDPATGNMGADTTASQPAKAVILPLTNADRFAAGGMVREGERTAYIQPGLAWPPDPATKMTDAAGKVWQIESVEPLGPAGLDVLYTARVTG